MKTSNLVRRALASATLAALFLSPAAQAQTHRTKAPPRLPPDSAATTRIPAGTDTGSPTTSSSVSLGTPVPPDASADRVEQRTRSAAARAAARPDPLTRTGVPLTPAAPVVGAAVIRDASRSTGQGPGRTAASRSTGDDAEATFRRSMSRCTDLLDRPARSSCIDRAVQARGAAPR